MLQHNSERKLTIVKSNPCNRTPHKTEERARQVLLLMQTRGVNTNRLRVIKCKHCPAFHLEYVK